MMDLEQKAIIVGVNVNNQSNFDYSMEELVNLAVTCEVEVVGELSQNLQRVNPSHYLGTGKTAEVKVLIEEHHANLVIFNDELSPSQIRNLEKELECKVIDRTILILDIFDKRAKTKEAQLQVEVAKLQYMLPRLNGLRESLGRQSGGVGTSNRGSGEKQIELDRRRIEDRIHMLNKELEDLVAHRQTQRKQRKKRALPVVALVGYTNAGKSTLMNAFVERFHPTFEEKQVFEKDMLFATLETSVRHIPLPDHKEFLLTDTVGFVSKLPHHLVKAFRSTLEEVAEADLLIHVVDYANHNYQQMIEITNQTLKGIGVGEISTIFAYNKADLMDEDIPNVEGDTIYLSAKKRIGMDELIDMIKKHLFHDYVHCQMLIPYDQGQIIAYLNEHANILETNYEEKGTLIKVECKPSDYEKYREFTL